MNEIRLLTTYRVVSLANCDNAWETLMLKLHYLDLLWNYCGFVKQQVVPQVHNRLKQRSLNITYLFSGGE